MSPDTGPLALVGATIFPSPTKGPIRDGVVLIRDGKIAAVGSSTAVEVPEAHDAIHDLRRKRALMSFPTREISDASEAAAAARRLVEEGVDGIRVHLQPPPPPEPPFPESAIAAAVREARRAGRPVFAHPNAGADVLAALRAGVDVIAHTTPHSGDWDEAIFDQVRERPVALTPTLTLWKHFLRHDRVSVQEKAVDTAVRQLQAWVAAGGTVLFGTDVGVVDHDPSEEGPRSQ